MSDTYKEGKRYWREAKRLGKEATTEMLDAVYRSMTWGSTEKIRRRNKKLWSRLLGKLRRRADKEIIEEQAIEETID